MASTGFGFRLPLAALTLLLAAGAPPAAAQRNGLREVHELGSAGLNLVVADPVGDFGRHVDVAGGVDAFGALNLGPGSPIALRLEGSFLVYGNDNLVVALPYYPLAITTTYSIATLGIGPQLTLGSGPMRLYGFGTFGFSYLSASTHYDMGGCGCGAIATATYFDDWRPALRGGGGLRVMLGGRHNPVSLDLGASYLHNGSTWYVAPGGVVPQPNGSVAIYPAHTSADLVIVHLGVSVGIR